MRAALCTRYGPPEVLQLRDVEKPVPQAHDVLVRIMQRPSRRVTASSAAPSPLPL
jgi:hypothetical protein